MKPPRPALGLTVCLPGFAFLGACAAVDTYFPVWGGALIGSVGVFFGLAFGGALPRSVADWCFGPEDASTEK
jgi:hypothetical protein